MSPQHLFVYGTLMPGRLRWPLLAPFVAAHRSAATAGTLFDSGRGWPVAVFAAAPLDGDPVVPGVLVELVADRLAECLVLMDEVEDIATDELRRVAVTTTDGVTAWAYHFAHATDGLRRIDRWHDVALVDEL